MTRVCHYIMLKSECKLKKGDSIMDKKVLTKETKERIIRTVESVCKGRCELVSVKYSESTDSMYFTIGKGGQFIYFRVSDHSTSANIKSFSVSNGTRMAEIERYVMNNIKRLNKRSLNFLLDSLTISFAVAV